MDKQAVLSKYHYEPSTGKFQRRGTKPDRGIIKTVKGYVRVFVGGKYLMAHHLVWLLHTGALPTKQIDHINGNKSDNRLANLRLVSRVENSQNRHVVSRKKANKLIGAYFIGNREKPWRAAIKVMGKLMNLGQFATEQEAHAVYLDAKRIYHPAFVLPNRG